FLGDVICFYSLTIDDFGSNSARAAAVAQATVTDSVVDGGVATGVDGALFWRRNRRSCCAYRNDHIAPQPLKWKRIVSHKDDKDSESAKPNGGLERKPTKTRSGGGSENPIYGFSYRIFSCEELARATDDFSSANLLGQGGFGYVHKGVLSDGKEVAVKQLKFGSGQGEREFQAEVDTISRVQQKHLVSLVGYCISGDQRLLVYEFVPNKTLEFHLHEGSPPMNWSTRLKIALGAASGLAYLHEDCHPKIIHRDIKASNILLDDDFEAKVADFGLAKFSNDNDTHVSTRVMGTFGYLAPEYASSGKLTEKSDVYSFGVVLLELITGRRPIDKGHCFMDDSMVEWARPLLREALETGKFEGLVDPNLEDYNSSEMSQMLACAAACVQHSARRRPRMSQITEALEGNLSIDEICSDMSPTSSAVCGSSDYDTYKDSLKKFRKLALGSQDLSTSGLSAVTSDINGIGSISSTDNQNEESLQDTGSANSKKDDEDVVETSIL
ncbi:hypothetical protein V2J09_004645, partial [Rumex salicifolius]